MTSIIKQPNHNLFLLLFWVRLSGYSFDNNQCFTHTQEKNQTEGALLFSSCISFSFRHKMKMDVKKGRRCSSFVCSSVGCMFYACWTHVNCQQHPTKSRNWGCFLLLLLGVWYAIGTHYVRAFWLNKTNTRTLSMETNGKQMVNKKRLKKRKKLF